MAKQPESMKAMMDRLGMEIPDEKTVELRTRYENARIAVDMGYRHAAVLGQGGGADSDNYIAYARKISAAIEYDLNSKLEMLDAKSEPAKHS